MSTSGPFGITFPDPGDTGDTFYQELRDFMVQIASHKHDGVDSEDISLNIAKAVQNLQAGVDYTWVLQSNGIYRATVALPSGATFNGNLRTFYIANGPDIDKQFYPTTQANDATSYFIYSSDNTLDLKIITV